MKKVEKEREISKKKKNGGRTVATVMIPIAINGLIDIDINRVININE